MEFDYNGDREWRNDVAEITSKRVGQAGEERKWRIKNSIIMVSNLIPADRASSSSVFDCPLSASWLRRSIWSLSRRILSISCPYVGGRPR
jgi:hypothetical protein